MTLHPEIAAILDATRSELPIDPRTVPIDQRRRQYRELARSLWPSSTPMAECHDITLNLATKELNARLYVPESDEGRGLVVFFHGGSFVVGDLDTHDGLCRRLADDTSLRVLAVDYRLAPEYPFPSAVDDAVESVAYAAAHLSEFAAPDARLVVMGDSAGATLAAVAANAARAEGISLAAQVLIYPTLGPDVFTESAQKFATGFFLELDQLRYDYELYLGSWADHTDTRISPLMNLDLTGAAPAVVVVAQYDPLRDEGLAYAGLLEHFGTPVEVLEAEGMVHGFLRLGSVVPDAMDIVDDVAEHVNRFVERSA